MMQSKLNPLATSFVPTKESNSIRKIAKQLLQEFFRNKSILGEKLLTKEELSNLVEKLISYRYNIGNVRDQLAVKAYLRSKIPELLGCTNFNYTKTENSSQAILKSFWGLYRQEPSLRPTLSLTNRPQTVENDIWSVSTKDLKLWNPTYVQSCDCPPVFGYSIPPDFFGNPFNLKYRCSHKCVHLNNYMDTCEGNEFILTQGSTDYTVDMEPFTDDFEEKIKVEISLELYPDQMKSIVSGVCNLIASFDKGSNVDDMDEERDFIDIYWDKEFNFDRYDLDDNYHPLLEVPDENDEGVSVETMDKIEQCLSLRGSKFVPATPGEAFHPVVQNKLFLKDSGKGDRNATVVVGDKSASDSIMANQVGYSSKKPSGMHCNPPCSVWCDNQTCGKTDLGNKKSVINILNETKDLINEITNPKPSFKRSFSINDGDSEYFQKFRAGVAQKVFGVSSDTLLFLRNDPSKFFKLMDSKKQWSTNSDDSGILSHWSSREDVRSDSIGESFCLEKNMWSVYSGDDSAWEPLPDLDKNQGKMPPRRGYLRRQMSML